MLPGRSVSPAIPSDSVTQGNVLLTTHSVGHLVADGSQVAVTYPKATQACIESWDPVVHSLTRYGAGGCWEPTYCCSLGADGFVSFGLAGQTIARMYFEHFAGLDIFDLYVSTADRPTSVQITDVCPDNRYGDCLMPEGDLSGDGDLLVFDTWTESCANPSYPSACAKSPKKDGRLWRLDGTHAVKVASGTGALTPLSVDAGRILVDHENGTLELLDRNGASLHTYALDPASVRGARLQGRDLVVTTPTAVEVTDADTGTFLRRWPLPADAKLTDLQDGIAVLVAGTDIHLLRLADGTDSVIHAPGTGPVLAQLEPAGLFYSYTADDPTYPGRVVFVPFAQLPLR